MNKLTSLKHLQQGDVIYHFEHGWMYSFTFLMMCPDNPEVAYLEDFWGSPVSLHMDDINDITSEWFEKCTNLEIIKYRREYYREMASRFERLYELELQK